MPKANRRPLAGFARRRALAWLATCGAMGVCGAWPASAWAGRQREENLADAVRTALSAAIASQAAPPEPVFANEADRRRFLTWMDEMGRRLERRKPTALIRQDFLKTVWYESRRSGLQVSLVLGLIEVESAFRKFAISSASARGYMQVMPFWVRSIGDGDVSKLFHMQTNIRFGCVILRHYLDAENGDLFMALGRYNGSRGQAAYPRAVLAAQKRWLYTPPGDGAGALAAL